MPFRFTIDPARRLVIVVGSGELVDLDFFTIESEIWSRPEVAGFDQIVDMTDVTGIIGISASKLRALAALSSKYDPPTGAARMAIVSPDPLLIALGHAYASIRRAFSPRGKRVMTFWTMAEALSWLGWNEPERKETG